MGELSYKQPHNIHIRPDYNEALREHLRYKAHAGQKHRAHKEVRSIRKRQMQR
jgi:hypothetical protein